METMDTSATGIKDDTELVAASQTEPNDNPPEGSQLVVGSQGPLGDEASQKELENDTRDAVQNELKHDNQKGTDPANAVHEQFKDDTQEVIEQKAAFPTVVINNRQERTELLTFSQKEVRAGTRDEAEPGAASQEAPDNNNPEGTNLVGASRKDPVNDAQEGGQPVVASWKEVVDDNQEGTGLMSASQKDRVDDPHEGGDLVLASQTDVSDDNKQVTGLVSGSQNDSGDDPHEEKAVIDDNKEVTGSQNDSGDDPHEEKGLVVVSPQEVIDHSQDETELVRASRKDRTDEPQAGAEVVVASQMEITDDSQEGTELLRDSHKDRVDDPQGGSEVVKASRDEIMDDNIKGTELVRDSRKDRVDDPQWGSEVVVVASQMEIMDGNQEGTEQIRDSQKDRVDDPQRGREVVEESRDEIMDGNQGLVRDSQEDRVDVPQGGSEVVEASRDEIMDDNKKGTELVRDSQKDRVDDPQGGGEVVVIATQTEIIDGNQEGTELMRDFQKDPVDDPQGGSEVVEASQDDIMDDNQGLVRDSQKDRVDVSQGGSEVVVVASQMEIMDDSQEGTELMRDSQKDRVNDPQGSELMIASREEAIDSPHGGTEPVAASRMESLNGTQEQTEPVAISQREPGSTYGSANATSTITEAVALAHLPFPTNVCEIPGQRAAEQSGNPTQAVSGGRKMKLKDMARRKSSASPANARAAARNSKPRRQPRLKSVCLQPQSIPTQSPSTGSTIEAFRQPLPFPHSSPNALNVNNSLPQSQFSPSGPLGPFPSIILPPPHHQQVSPLRFDELLQATNSVSWRPVVDCDSAPYEPHPVHPPSATASVHPPPADVIAVDTPGLPLPGRGTPFSSGKPPRPPSQTPFRGVKRSHPSDLSNPSTLQQNVQQAPIAYSPNLPPLACRQPGTPHGGLSARASQPWQRADEQSGGPSPLSEAPELDPLDDSESPSPQSKRKKSSPGGLTLQQKRRLFHKRKLHQLRTQVIKKLKIWGRESKLMQDAAGAGQDSNDERVIMSEEQRDAVVQNMVESCRKDPQMRETFLATVKRLANHGVLHSSARLLMDQDPSGKSQEVFKAWKEMHLESEDNASAAVGLYKAVEELHKQGEEAMGKLSPMDDSSSCSLGKTSDGAWELLFPPQRGVTNENEKRLDEPLGPSQSTTFIS